VVEYVLRPDLVSHEWTPEQRRILARIEALHARQDAAVADFLAEDEWEPKPLPLI
jgi:hypothetical protein